MPQTVRETLAGTPLIGFTMRRAVKAPAAMVGEAPKAMVGQTEAPRAMVGLELRAPRAMVGSIESA